MDILIIIALIVAAIILLLVELFIIPGISLAGIFALVSLSYANYYAFVHVNNTVGIITLICSIISCVAAIYWFMHSKTIDKIALQESNTAKVNKEAAQKVQIGDQGVSITRLAEIGNADFQGNIIEVKSAKGFIDENTSIEVVRITDGIIFVRPVK